MSEAERGTVLLDVTRLLWRRWRGGLPTGVDRVCLAYVAHYGPGARAVIQRKGFKLVLSRRSSQRLFDLLSAGGPGFRSNLIGLLMAASPALLDSRPPRGALYLNVGHTGLDEPALPAWIARHRLRAIYLIHDLIPITHPQFCRAGEDRKHERRMRNALVSGAGLIANSQDTANEMRRLADRLGLAMPPTVVAWLSGDALHRLPAPAPAGRPYFVVLGTIEARKNHQLLLRVWTELLRRLGPETPRLIIVGTRGWEADDVLAQLDALGRLQPYVEERSRCSDDELGELLAGARALLMPSFAEGYGLPVFEALELGTPVIAANLAVYREIAGDIPCYLPPDDPDAWANAVIAFVADGPDRSAQLDRMRGFTVPDWAAHFAKVDQWLDGLPDPATS
ncbi:glycosyltransferase family 1 protein [Sphingomonas humi]|uniref:Glycosyltransferase family 1 protein n=1 Tax=Sphingomonas humi TaxID=335630 RepID=A0ABP7S2F2_9SPHN